MLVTVVETPEFIKQAAGLLSEKELEELKYHLSATPRAGDLIQGTGGVRKLRWAAKGKGKSGGVRVLHFYRSTSGRLFLLGVYSKSIKIALTQAERNVLKEVVKTL